MHPEAELKVVLVPERIEPDWLKGFTDDYGVDEFDEPRFTAEVNVEDWLVQGLGIGSKNCVLDEHFDPTRDGWWQTVSGTVLNAQETYTPHQMGTGFGPVLAMVNAEVVVPGDEPNVPIESPRTPSGIPFRSATPGYSLFRLDRLRGSTVRLSPLALDNE